MVSRRMTTARRAPGWGAEEISTAPHFSNATQQGNEQRYCDELMYIGYIRARCIFRVCLRNIGNCATHERRQIDGGNRR
jgi:hypothetical protein